MNLNTIIEAWIISMNPTEEQISLAKKRLEICDTCTSKKEVIKRLKLLTICSECGCPIQKKIFTNIYDACPLDKWRDVDKDYFKNQKGNRTLL